jgi:hypothetical protein
VTVVRSRFVMLVKVLSKETATVVAALSQHVGQLPATLRRSLRLALNGLPDCTRIRACQSDADWRFLLLVTEENEVGSAPHAKLAEEIGDVELHGALGDMQSTPDLFVGKVLQQSI